MAHGANAVNGNPNVGLPKPVAIKFLYYRNYNDHSHEGPPGIAVQEKTEPLYNGTLRTLQALQKTTTGGRVIDCLVRCGKSIKIQAAQFSNSCDVGKSGMTRVAEELADGNFGPSVKKAFEKAYENVTLVGRPHKFGWLANKINHSPVYSMGREATFPAKDLGVTGEQVEAWMKGVARVEGHREKAHVINSLIVALDDYSDPGEGSSAAIAFYAGEGNANGERPAGIGLAHELIHAYWGVLGRNPGYPIGHDTTVLFEHKCVGLGHWEHLSIRKTVCENQIRAEWPSAAARVLEPNDYLNRGLTPRRNFYDD